MNDLIAERLRNEGKVKGMIDEISREFDWDRGGGRCFEGMVSF